MPTRPAPVGHYEVLTDFEIPALSVRVLQLDSRAGEIEGHVHARSTQVYLAIEGQTVVMQDGKETILEPFSCAAVVPQTVHSARALAGKAIVVNISVPPLAADDQLPAGPQPYRADLQMPTSGSDIDD